jgi:DNA (cytosine-5)-methyltransferase 1
MLRVIREVQPRYVFVENVAGLVWRGIDVVISGLVASGYDTEWSLLGASDVGASHQRKRCWVLGKLSDSTCRREELKRQAHRFRRIYQDVPDTDSTWEQQSERNIEEQRRRISNVLQEISDRDWWKVEPCVRGISHGIPRRLDRIAKLGLAQVPLCAAVAWKMLFERIKEKE